MTSGQRGDGEDCVSKDDGEKKKKKKRFAPIRRDGRLPEHRRLITRSVYVYACTTRSETRLINHSSPGRTEAMDLHNCVHTHTHTSSPLRDLWLLNMNWVMVHKLYYNMNVISNFKNLFSYEFLDWNYFLGIFYFYLIFQKTKLKYIHIIHFQLTTF